MFYLPLPSDPPYGHLGRASDTQGNLRLGRFRGCVVAGHCAGALDRYAGALAAVVRCVVVAAAEGEAWTVQ